MSPQGTCYEQGHAGAQGPPSLGSWKTIYLDMNLSDSTVFIFSYVNGIDRVIFDIDILYQSSANRSSRLDRNSLRSPFSRVLFFSRCLLFLLKIVVCSW
jgi:hypothetical protein